MVLWIVYDLHGKSTAYTPAPHPPSSPTVLGSMNGNGQSSPGKIVRDVHRWPSAPDSRGGCQATLKTNSRQPPRTAHRPADRSRRLPSGSTGTFAHGCSTPHACTAQARHPSNILSFLSVVFTPRQKTVRQRRMTQTFQPDVQPADALPSPI